MEGASSFQCYLEQSQREIKKTKQTKPGLAGGNEFSPQKNDSKYVHMKSICTPCLYNPIRLS